VKIIKLETLIFIILDSHDFYLNSDSLFDAVLSAFSSDFNSLTLRALKILAYSATAILKVWVNVYKFTFAMLNGKIFLLVIYLRPEHHLHQDF